ncbi:hypothetical protein K491DRAFT_695238 [Lophiostoma macrostomum CBS 122681]|uniref:Uncharacterized protein n=1 Tax=Lophiostoma macrostomum CBS 122681 TaxID=1314788 RepID=A0A6A6SZ10_9PLEO|nr:hypothetical protein K491DRAFT_695238 [Lophiostoma macrostomum CBS 122681]
METDAVPAKNYQEDGVCIEHTELPSLPVLSKVPHTYPGCCLSLSAPLLSYLGTLMPAPPNIVLSVGSGYGLLEALLLSHVSSLSLVGVEVQPSSNRHLPASHHQSVPGSRSLHPLAAEATTWLFVYPKRVGLLEEYLCEFGGLGVVRIIWAGPQADWDDYKTCFERPDSAMRWNISVKSADTVGGRPWDLIAIANIEKTHAV